MAKARGGILQDLNFPGIVAIIIIVSERAFVICYLSCSG